MRHYGKIENGVQRQAERVEVDLGATVRLRDGSIFPVNLTNISEQGFMADMPSRVPIGSPVELSFPDRTVVGAQVRWEFYGRVGCKFDEPISRERLFDALLIKDIPGARSESGR